MDVSAVPAESTTAIEHEQFIQGHIQHLLALGIEEMQRNLERQQDALLKEISCHQNFFFTTLERFMIDVERRWNGGSITNVLGHSYATAPSRSSTLSDRTQFEHAAPRQEHYGDESERSDACSAGWQTLESTPSNPNPTTFGKRSLRSVVEAAKRGQTRRPQKRLLGTSAQEGLSVYALDRLNMDDLIEAERQTPESNPRHREDQRSVSSTVDHRFVPEDPGEPPSPSSLSERLSIQHNMSNAQSSVGGADAALSFGFDPAVPDMPERSDYRMRRETRTSCLVSIDRARLDQETAIISTHSAAWSGLTIAGAPRWLRCPRFVLMLSGVLPFSVCKMRCCCAPLVFALCGLTFLFSSYTLFVEGVNVLSVVCACYALGGGIGLYSLRSMSIHDLLGADDKLLERYAIKHKFLEAWASRSLRLLASFGFLWVVAILSIAPLVLSQSTSEDGGEGGVSSTVALTFSFIFLSGVVTVLTYCHLHVCAGLELMLDTFCVEFIQNTDFRLGVVQWNMMQAIMRRAAQTIDLCFLSVQASVLTATVLVGMDVVLVSGIQNRALLSLPSNLFMVAIMYLGQYRTAAVTQKCFLAPSLMNSLANDGPAINDERQYFVQFITQSAAGFYVRGVRITMFTVVKCAYLFVMATFGVAMRLSRSASNP